jgi:hypothetical protein
MKRSTVIINVISLVLLVLYFEIFRTQDLDPVLLIYELVPVVVLLISFFRLQRFRKTITVPGDPAVLRSNEVLKTAYSLYAVIVCSILLAWHLAGHELNMILIVSFLYLAHVIPIYLRIWISTKKI